MRGDNRQDLIALKAAITSLTKQIEITKKDIVLVESQLHDRKTTFYDDPDVKSKKAFIDILGGQPYQNFSNILTPEDATEFYFESFFISQVKDLGERSRKKSKLIEDLTSKIEMMINRKAVEDTFCQTVLENQKKYKILLSEQEMKLNELSDQYRELVSNNGLKSIERDADKYFKKVKNKMISLIAKLSADTLADSEAKVESDTSIKIGDFIYDFMRLKIVLEKERPRDAQLIYKFIQMNKLEKVLHAIESPLAKESQLRVLMNESSFKVGMLAQRSDNSLFTKVSDSVSLYNKMAKILDATSNKFAEVEILTSKPVVGS